MLFIHVIVHAIETCVLVCLQVMATFATHLGLLHFLMWTSDSDSFFKPQLVQSMALP